MNTLNLTPKDFTLFTDSQVALYWNRLSPDRLSDWHLRKLSVLRTHKFRVSYCRSSDNPSDLGTKPGTLVKDLDSHFFRHGPSWLVQPRQCWPQEIPELDLTSESYVSGLKRGTVDIGYKTTLATFATQQSHLFNDAFAILDGFYVSRMNDFMKIKKLLGILLRWPLRIKHKLRKMKDASTPELDLVVDAQNEASNFLFRFHQAREFKEE